MNPMWEGRDLLSGLEPTVLRSLAEAWCRPALRRGVDRLPGRGGGGRGSRSACCCLFSFRVSLHLEKEFKNCRVWADDRYIRINLKGDCMWNLRPLLFSQDCV